MAALFDLNHEEEEEFSLACRSVFRKLLNIVYLELLQKNSEKTSSRITAWYTRISYRSHTYMMKFGLQNFLDA